MEYVCKYCGRVKGNASGWLLGFEGIAGGKTMKGAISLLGKWDEKRANERTALHFCSIACQTKYLVENYGDNSWAA